MNTQLAENVQNSTARKESRASNAAYVLQHPGLADDLITLALEISNENHFKACWILELALEKQIGWLTPRLDDFCSRLLLWKNDSALRSVAKICMFSAQHHLGKDRSFLSEQQIAQITEACFQWLISEEKVAVKAYAIRALYQLGKLQSWVYPELAPILQQGFPNHTAAYKAVSKDVLKRILP